MSVYSGKCDIADIREINGDRWDFNKTKIFIDDNIAPLRIDCEKDLVPYYPYLESYGSGDADGNIIIHLSSQSFVDMEEEDWLTNRLNDFIRYWKKCKRNKKEFTIEECLKNTCCTVSDYYQELAERVAMYGDKAKINGIHTKSHDRYRTILYEEMLRVGYNEKEAFCWCFGWQRYFDRMLKEKEQ